MPATYKLHISYNSFQNIQSVIECKMGFSYCNTPFNKLNVSFATDEATCLYLRTSGVGKRVMWSYVTIHISMSARHIADNADFRLHCLNVQFNTTHIQRYGSCFLSALNSMFQNVMFSFGVLYSSHRRLIICIENTCCWCDILWCFQFTD